MFKRVSSFAVAVAMLFTMMCNFVIAQAATEPMQMSLTSSATQVNGVYQVERGEGSNTVDVIVAVKNYVPAVAIGVLNSIDTDVLTYAGNENGEIGQSDYYVCNPAYVVGENTYIAGKWIAAQNFAANAEFTLWKLTYTVNANAPLGKTTLTFSFNDEDMFAWSDEAEGFVDLVAGTDYVATSTIEIEVVECIHDYEGVEYTKPAAGTSKEEAKHSLACKKCDELVVTDCSFDEEGVVTPPNCTEDGYITYTCSVCGYEAIEEGEPATDHNMGNWEWNQAGNRADSKHSRFCTNSGCDASEVVACTNWTTVETPATCEANKFIKYTCEDCGAVYNEEQLGTKLEHDLEYVQDAPGKHHQECKDCEYATDPVDCNIDWDGKAHDCVCGYTVDCEWSAWAWNNEGLKENSTHTHTCTVGNVDHTESEACTIEVKSRVEATCYEDGLITYGCTDNCGAVYTEVIKATGEHNMVYVANEDGTHYMKCTTDGCTETTTPEACTYPWNEAEQAHKCVCGNTTPCVWSETAVHNDAATKDASMHTFTCNVGGTAHEKEEKCDFNAVITAPTCTTDGYTTYTCKVAGCGAVYTGDVVGKLGHDYTNAPYVQVPDQEGYHYQLCTRDDCDVPNEPAECNIAWTDGDQNHTCELCGYEKTCQWSNWAPNNAIAKDDYEHERTCTVGGLQHKESQPCVLVEDTSVRVEPTCYQTGTATFKCATCGRTHTETLAATEEHTLSWVSDNDGKHRQECTFGDCPYATAWEDCDTTWNADTEDHKCDTCGYFVVCNWNENEVKHDTTTTEANAKHIYTCTVDGEDKAHTKTEACKFVVQESDATCTTPGITTYKCSVCNYEYTTTDAEPLGHDYVYTHKVVDGVHKHDITCSRCNDYTSEGTCDLTWNAETQEHKCALCKEVVDCAWGEWDWNEEVNKEDSTHTHTCTVGGTAHTETADCELVEDTEARVEPTCYQTGSATYRCAACGATYTETLAATEEHTLSWVSDDAGKHRQECTFGECPYATEWADCDVSWNEEAQDHKCDTCGYTVACSWSEWEWNEEENKEDSTHTHTCTVGGTAHTETADCELVEDTEARVEPTCYQTGSATYKCAACGATYTETLAATEEHTLSWVSDDAGKHRQECTFGECPYATEWADCDVSWNEEAQDHKCDTCGYTVACSWGEWEWNEEENKEDSTHTHTCTVGGTAHTETADCELVEDTEARVEPTCYQTGSATYKCAACGATYTETLAATEEHTLSWVSDDAGKHRQECTFGECPYATEWADCDVSWNEEAQDHKCDTCGYTVACSWSEWEWNEEENKEDSTHTHTCTVGGTSHTETADCEFTETKVEATCGVAGSITYTCDCGAEYVETIPATGAHDYVYTHKGEVEGVHMHTITCKNCDLSEEEACTIGEWEVTKDPTRDETGLRVRKCEKCDYVEEEVIAKIAYFVLNGEESVVTGNTWTVDVAIKNNPGVSGMSLLLDYDNTVLKLTDAAFKGEVTNGFIEANDSNEAVLVKWPAITGDDAIITLTFEVLETAAAGEYTLTVSTEDAVDGSDMPQQIEIEEASITVDVKAFIWGDVNNDGTADAKDVVLVLRYNAQLTTYDELPKPDAADVDGEAGIDLRDAVLILRFVVDLYDPTTATV